MKIRSIKPVIYFITMKSVKSHLFICALAAIIFPAVPVHSQKHAELEAKADLVSSYIWRGTYNAGAKHTTVTQGFHSRILFRGMGFDRFRRERQKRGGPVGSLTYKNFSAGITDYWWEGEGAYKYFNFKSHETGHHFEAGLAYTCP